MNDDIIERERTSMIVGIIIISLIILLTFGMVLVVFKHLSNRTASSGMAQAGPSGVTLGLPTLHWDWRKEHTRRSTAWPSNVTDTIWFIEDPVRVIIDLPDGKTFDMRVEHAHVWRMDDVVEGALFLFPIETDVAARARAKRLLADWNFADTHQLDEWAKTPEKQRLLYDHFGARGPNDSPVDTSVNIANSYSLDLPWCVEFGIGIRKTKQEVAADLERSKRPPGSYFAHTGNLTRGPHTDFELDLQVDGKSRLVTSWFPDTRLQSQRKALGTWAEIGGKISVTLETEDGIRIPPDDARHTMSFTTSDVYKHLKEQSGLEFERLDVPPQD